MSNALDLKPKERFASIPDGYTCSTKGVTKGEEEQITLKPITVKAGTRDGEGNNWGMLIWWLDLDNRPHEIAIPKRLVHAQSNELAQLLADGGLPIVPGKERQLLTYLALFDPPERMIAANATGWLNDAFVLPRETINEPEGERIVYQPTGLPSHARAMCKSGSLEDWQSGMADASEIIIFLVCASLSAPVRYMVGVEAGGFHIYTETSRGKTTGLQATASVWGSGADPQRAGGAETLISRWNATSNALEAKAELHNDLPMIVDEIGEGDVREFGRTIYRIFSGTGRDRSNKNGGLQDSKSWRVCILSAGELATSEFIESGGSKLKGGQLVRMVDINLDHAPALLANSAQADAMKDLCATHYGHAGPEFLWRVPNVSEGWKSLDHSLIGPANTPITERVRKRFALVLHTGFLAVQAGILPWTEEKVLKSVRTAYRAWLNQASTVSDTARGVSSVLEFLLAHESRFETGAESYAVRDRAGWKRSGLYHFTPAAFKEACAGADATKVKQNLKAGGFLHVTKGLNSVITVNGQSVNVISVKASFLSSVQGGSDGNGSSEPETERTSTATTPESTEVVTCNPESSEQLPPLPPLPAAHQKPEGKFREEF